MAGASSANQSFNRAQMAEGQRRLEAIMSIAKMSSQTAVTKIAVQVTAAVLLELSRVGTGKTYYVVRSKATGLRYWSDNPDSDHMAIHVASAPGNPPAADTGVYRRSWHYLVGKDENGFYSQVYSTMNLSEWLEFGTVHMAARPHLRPVVAATADDFHDLVAEEMARAELQVAGDLSMTATIGGALRSVIADSGIVGNAVYRDLAPPQLPPPYVVFTDYVADPASLQGDSIILYRKRTIQIDLYQTMADESDDLLTALQHVVDGAQLADTVHVVQTRLMDTHRMAEPIYNYVRHMLTVNVSYQNT